MRIKIQRAWLEQVNVWERGNEEEEVGAWGRESK